MKFPREVVEALCLSADFALMILARSMLTATAAFAVTCFACLAERLDTSRASGSLLQM